MRSLFKPQPDGPGALEDQDTGADKATGWNALSGTKKLLLVGGVAATVIAAVVVPGLNTHRTVQAVDANQSHTPSQIKSYTPPPAPGIVSRMTGNTTAAASAPMMVRHVPVPTEMELYAGNGVSNGGAGTAGYGGGGGGSAAQQSASADSDPNGDGLATTHATLVRNASFTIRAGAVIPCLPVDAQDSSRPGYTTCRVPEWFRSTDQRRGLLPPGTLIFGQIRSGISNGQRRLGVIYTKIETPEFNMTLAAPGADVMGRAGLDGDVHTFFWDKVGAVAVYALMDVAVGAGTNLGTSALSNSFAGGGTTLDFGNQAQSLASEEFQSWSNRPPILTRDQALPMTVTVGQDLDFGEACKLALTVNPMACPLQ